MRDNARLTPLVLRCGAYMAHHTLVYTTHYLSLQPNTSSMHYATLLPFTATLTPSFRTVTRHYNDGRTTVQSFLLVIKRLHTNYHVSLQSHITVQALLLAVISRSPQNLPRLTNITHHNGTTPSVNTITHTHTAPSLITFRYTPSPHHLTLPQWPNVEIQSSSTRQHTHPSVIFFITTSGSIPP